MPITLVLPATMCQDREMLYANIFRTDIYLKSDCSHDKVSQSFFIYARRSAVYQTKVTKLFFLSFFFFLYFKMLNFIC